MDKRDLAELKRRMKKEACTFTRLCGCYVDAERNKVTSFGERFLALDDEELLKYLEIAKKTLSGTLSDNLLELPFPIGEEEPGGRQRFLMGLRECGLDNAELVDSFYDRVIESYRYVGNYLILLFHDAYDVISRTSDRRALDDSEEVYEYLLCAICPVTLSKPGLGYRPDENRIAPRLRDWVVGAPDAGFLFPAFTDRSADIHAALFYTRDPKAPCAEIAEEVLGCPCKLTATEKKLTFQNIVRGAIGEGKEESDALFFNIQANLQEMLPADEDGEDGQPAALTAEDISELLSESGVPEDAAAKIEKSYGSAFADELPLASQLADAKLAAEGGRRRERRELFKQVEGLKKQLEDTLSLPIDAGGADAYGNGVGSQGGAAGEDGIDSQGSATGTSSVGGETGANGKGGADDAVVGGKAGASDQDGMNGDAIASPAVRTYDVVLRVKPEKVGQIRSQVINGQRCLVIPMGENEHAAVNGVNATI